jgi:adenylylsulfate kinase
MIVIMAGLPATGKSTLARRLASALNGLVIDKDAVRLALFSAFVDYRRDQDDLCMDAIFSAAAYMAFRHASVPVFIDGCTFARRAQFEPALNLVQTAAAPWRVIETVCSDESARERLEAALAVGEHPAGNRTFDLYKSLKAGAEPITVPKLLVNTDRPLEQCFDECLAYIR